MIRGLSVLPHIRVEIMRANALEPLILAADSESIEVQREVAAALANLAMAEENKSSIAERGGLPALVKLARSRDRERERYSTAAIANVAEMLDGRAHSLLINEGALDAVLSLVETPLEEVKREVARTLALFASREDSHQALMRAGGHERLMGFLRSKDTLCARFAALGVGNLALVPAAHAHILHRPAMAALVSLADADDVETRRCVAFALNNLATNEANHGLLERVGVAKPLISLAARFDDTDTHLQAVIGLRHLALHPKCRVDIVAMGGLAPLLELASMSGAPPEVGREVTCALRNVSLSESGKVAL